MMGEQKKALQNYSKASFDMHLLWPIWRAISGEIGINQSSPCVAYGFFSGFHFADSPAPVIAWREADHGAELVKCKAQRLPGLLKFYSCHLVLSSLCKGSLSGELTNNPAPLVIFDKVEAFAVTAERCWKVATVRVRAHLSENTTLFTEREQRPSFQNSRLKSDAYFAAAEDIISTKTDAPGRSFRL